MGDKTEEMNIASLCTTIHCARGDGNRLAMRWVDADLNFQDFTFSDLEAESNRMANLLWQVGVQPGDRVAVFLPKLPEVFFGILGILKIQAIACPLFSNFGEDALMDRLGDAGVKVVISKKSLLRKLNNIREKIPTLQTIILVDVDEHQADGVYSLPLLRTSLVTNLPVLLRRQKHHPFCITPLDQLENPKGYCIIIGLRASSARPVNRFCRSNRMICIGARLTRHGSLGLPTGFSLHG